MIVVVEWVVKVFVNFVKLDVRKGAVDGSEIDVTYMQQDIGVGRLVRVTIN